MRTVLIVLALACALGPAAPATSRAAASSTANVTADDLLKSIDQNLTFDTRKATVKMTVLRNGRRKVYEMQSYGRGADEAAIEFTAPARDKGTRMLKKGGELWIYMPSIEKVQKISGHMLRQGMMGSDISYEDLLDAAKLREQYDATVVGTETIDGRPAWKVDLKAKPGLEDVAYPHRVTWIDQQDRIPLKQELYALSGMLLKTWSMGEVKEIDGRHFPMKWVVVDQLQKGSTTELDFEQVQFSVPLQAEVFNLRWLER